MSRYWNSHWRLFWVYWMWTNFVEGERETEILCCVNLKNKIEGPVLWEMEQTHEYSRNHVMWISLNYQLSKKKMFLGLQLMMIFAQTQAPTNSHISRFTSLTNFSPECPGHRGSHCGYIQIDIYSKYTHRISEIHPSIHPSLCLQTNKHTNLHTCININEWIRERVHLIYILNDRMSRARNQTRSSLWLAMTSIHPSIHLFELIHPPVWFRVSCWSHRDETRAPHITNQASYVAHDSSSQH